MALTTFQWTCLYARARACVCLRCVSVTNINKIATAQCYKLNVSLSRRRIVVPIDAPADEGVVPYEI